MKKINKLILKSALSILLINVFSDKPIFSQCKPWSGPAQPDSNDLLGDKIVCIDNSTLNYSVKSDGGYYGWSITGNCKNRYPTNKNFNFAVSSREIVKVHEAVCSIYPEYSESSLAKEKKQTAEEYMTKGFNKLSFDDYGQAFEYFNKAIDSDPEFYDVYPVMIQANIFRLMDYEEALLNLNLLIGNELKLNANKYFGYEFKEKKFYTNYLRGFSKSELQDYKGAISDYKKVIDHYRNLSNIPNGWNQTNILAQSYYGTGVAKFNIMDFSGAIDSFSEAIKIDPNYSQAYYARGFAKLEMRDIDGGCSDSEIAFKKGYKALGLDSLGEIGVSLCF